MGARVGAMDGRDFVSNARSVRGCKGCTRPV